ncbi:WecB/TagA/CpsF family glycosyltransferase [Alkaliphilus serpentinus]|uniref:N-acetylglucosaminyldiphosphoundecaprenol N-acetyl-beta-D-mannosaminyltransferase n=1 Tax=Alkaliphilus serpentinus TaxID=1482731 RepID=A0A833HRP0_9FIRM|nr:WecB/TagA/CpsF family glycosyltransferase [Alkaliphilus serpentinus]KAB3533552.1 WecB/TagA/CpsF family glycosyltransferase [Alkaliphilus serpentinus]
MIEKISIFDVPISAVTQSEALEMAIDFLNSEGLKQIFTPNPEIVMLAQNNQQLKETLQKGDLVVPDGIGLILASKLKSLGLKERVPGIELMDKILEYCSQNHKSIYIFGGKPGIPERAIKNIEEKHPGIRIAGYHHGYLQPGDEEKIIEDINGSKVDVLIVGLGAPKQEIWISNNKNRLRCKIAMGVGGSIDVYAGVVKRAPLAFQRVGLEWFYRLIKEPRRYKRMLLLPKFLIRFIIKG